MAIVESRQARNILEHSGPISIVAMLIKKNIRFQISNVKEMFTLAVRLVHWHLTAMTLHLSSFFSLVFILLSYSTGLGERRLYVTRKFKFPDTVTFLNVRESIIFSLKWKETTVLHFFLSVSFIFRLISAKE
jgi:hypothetical protein